MGKKRTSTKVQVKPYKGDLEAAIHQTMDAVYKGGGIAKKTMRHFDKMCLAPAPILTPKEIKRIRDKENASQAFFADRLGISTSVVSQWERGTKQPSVMASRFLKMVAENGLVKVPQ